MTSDPAWFLPWFPVFFVAMWLFVGALLSQLSGWPSLAATYPGGKRPSGGVLRGQVTAVGIVGENNVTRMMVTPAGLFLYSHPLFRFRRPPVLVPWLQVRYLSQRRFLWLHTHKLDLGGVTTLRVKNEAYRAMEPMLPEGQRMSGRTMA